MQFSSLNKIILLRAMILNFFFSRVSFQWIFHLNYHHHHFFCRWKKWLENMKMKKLDACIKKFPMYQTWNWIFFCSENEKQKKNINKFRINAEFIDVFFFGGSEWEMCKQNVFFSFSHNASNVCVCMCVCGIKKIICFHLQFIRPDSIFFFWHTSAMIFSCSCNNRQTSEKQIKKNLKFKI